VRTPRRALILALGLLAATPTAASAEHFSLGVGAFEVTSKSALLWGHADESGKVKLHLARSKDLKEDRRTFSATASAANDNVLRKTVKGLEPGKRYWYRWLDEDGDKGPRGTFKAAPKASADTNISFAVSGDADAQRQTGQQNIFYNALKGNNGLGAQNFGVYARMAEEENHFNVNLGDTIYSDSEVPGQGALATTLAAKRAKYRMNIAVPALQKVRRTGAMYNQWDDHEIRNDFTPPEFPGPIFAAGKKAFREYMPTKFSKDDGMYRRQRWGKHLDLFRLDGRSFRSAKASANGTCDNPQTGEPDLAPTMPQQQRNLYALGVPSLSQPVSQQCKDRINNPNRTLIGVHQRQRFLSEIKSSKATFKVILNQVPIQQFYALPYDRWEGYEFERKLVLRQLQNAGVKNVVWLTTDTHGNLINVIRYSTMEKAQPEPSPYNEFVTGPVSTMTYEREIDDATGGQGNGNAIDQSAFSAPPPNGVGMPCSNINIYSYAQVFVRKNELQVTARDVAGKVVRDQSDKTTACRLVIPKK
jgi:alkaline phosphatase D